MLINDYITASAGGSSGIVPLFWWQGWSGHWYLASVYSPLGFDCREAGTFVAARCDSSGKRFPLLVGTARNVSEELFSVYGEAFLRAVKAGANEIHVHLAAESDYQRDAAMNDIARAWQMPTPEAFVDA